MTSSTKLAIVNAHNGKGWYPDGQKRLINSLVHHGWAWDIEAASLESTLYGWTGKTLKVSSKTEREISEVGYDSQCVYTLKASIFDFLSQSEYTHLFWLDCSVWAIRNPAPLMDLLDTDGYYFWPSGFTLGQTCSDKCLEYFGISREEAHSIPDCSTSMFGLNLGNPKASKALDMWLKAAKAGMFHGSRDEIPNHPNGQMFYHRQDQSVMSCVIHKLGLKIHQPNIYSSYANNDGIYNDSVVFVMRGM